MATTKIPAPLRSDATGIGFRVKSARLGRFISMGLLSLTLLTSCEDDDDDSSDDSASEDSPSEDSPSEESPSEESPSEESPSEESPSEESPSEESPSEESPSEDEPSEDEPSEDEPSEESPSEDEPSEDEPSEDEPSEDEPSEDEPETPKRDCDKISWGTQGNVGEIAPRKDTTGWLDTDNDNVLDKDGTQVGMCQLHLTGRKCGLVLFGFQG